MSVINAAADELASEVVLLSTQGPFSRVSSSASSPSPPPTGQGLLRQYLPEGTDLSEHSAEDLMRIPRSLNGQPRKTLDYMMPVEKLAELVALTG